jgi:glycine/D-amino acid oxidase-like deaminating enzyme
MLDLSTGLPYHWILNGLPHQYPTLQQDHRCEVLVVGSGMTGALVAYACAKAGLGVTVVDARAVGTGSTAASTAFLQYEIDTPLHELIGQVGEQAAVRAYRLGLEAVEELITLGQALGVTSIRRRKSLQYASKRSHERDLKKEHTHRVANGIRVDLLSRTETKALIGSISAMALLSHDAAEVDPYALDHALLQETVRSGGSVFDRTEIISWQRSPKGPCSLKTKTGHRITADHVIMATGYESQQYLSKPVLDLNSTYAVASERIRTEPLWYEDCLIWETARPYLYLRTTPDRRVIVGGMDEPFRDPKRRDALLNKKTQRLTRAVNALMPSVPFAPEYAWCGTFGSTKDGLPYIGRDPGTGLWFVLGMGGNGMTFSQIGAHIVRDAILGRPNADAQLFSFDR